MAAAVGGHRFTGMTFFPYRYGTKYICQRIANSFDCPPSGRLQFALSKINLSKFLHRI
jgi:hypothetical protein